MKFIFTRLEIPDLIEAEYQRIDDARGFFAETYREREFIDGGVRGPFVQENHSRSARGVLRGLHYQVLPKAQAKLVQCVRGTIFDVAVDIRQGSPHYGKWVGRTLSDENKRMLYIPAGFAHGFLVLSEQADILYKVSDYFSKEHEGGIRWDDADLGIVWPQKPQSVAPKDAAYPELKQAQNNFKYSPK